jgi:hypothetical protein
LKPARPGHISGSPTRPAPGLCYEDGLCHEDREGGFGRRVQQETAMSAQENPFGGGYAVQYDGQYDGQGDAGGGSLVKDTPRT